LAALTALGDVVQVDPAPAGMNPSHSRNVGIDPVDPAPAGMNPEALDADLHP
jgi:hypothetical protein